MVVDHPVDIEVVHALDLRFLPLHIQEAQFEEVVWALLLLLLLLLVLVLSA